jgi:hypothetical protein
MISSIFQPNYPKAALGIASKAVSAVALQGNRRQLSVKQAATVDLPPGLVTPSFTEQNIADEREFIACLQEVVQSAGLMSQKKWAVTLPSNTARTAIIALESEPSSRQELDEVFDWKAEQSFGVPASELRLSREKISHDGEKRTRYFTTAVKLSILDEYESQFEALGWKAGLVLPRAVGEASWLMSNSGNVDSMLISGTNEGFTALLLRGDEPTVVRSVTCTPSEIDDEIYRLVMFYNDRFGRERGGVLDRLLVIGKSLVPASVQKIASDALGSPLRTLTPEEVGLNLPGGGLSFDDLAAPAGAASLGF